MSSLPSHRSIIVGTLAFMVGILSVGLPVCQWIASNDPMLHVLQIPLWVFGIGYIVSTMLILLSYVCSRTDDDLVYDYFGNMTTFESYMMPIGASVIGFVIIYSLEKHRDAKMRARGSNPSPT